MIVHMVDLLWQGNEVWPVWSYWANIVFVNVTCSSQSPLVQAKEKTINIRCSWAASGVTLSFPYWSDSVTDERLKKSNQIHEVTISLTHHKTIKPILFKCSKHYQLCIYTQDRRRKKPKERKLKKPIIVLHDVMQMNFKRVINCDEIKQR